MQEIDGRFGGKIRAWVDGVEFDEGSMTQASNVAALPFVHSHVAIMPDVHKGYGAAVGTVIPLKSAIIPYAVGVDIGCGMMAVRTTLTASDLPDNLNKLFDLISHAVPHGKPGPEAGWNGRSGVPSSVSTKWKETGLQARFDKLVDKHPKIAKGNNIVHLGTLGSGNHFIEICLDTEQRVWVMLHSGSRGIGNVIGTYFIDRAKEMMHHRKGVRPLDVDLAWFREGEQEFDDYVEAVSWAQDFARANREVMMVRVLQSMRDSGLPSFQTDKEAVNCHHNYVEKEHHFGEDVWVTRKGAVRARKDELGIIPGSMGAKSFIVRGKGNADSFCSCSHGAGRVLSRTAAKKVITLEDHALATAGVTCRKDESVIDESPRAYKDIDAVMAAQTDLIEVVATLKQVLCVKG